MIGPNKSTKSCHLSISILHNGYTFFNNKTVILKIKQDSSSLENQEILLMLITGDLSTSILHFQFFTVTFLCNYNSRLVQLQPCPTERSLERVYTVNFTDDGSQCEFVQFRQALLVSVSVFYLDLFLILYYGNSSRYYLSN